ncbi:MAG: hypothetical protein OEY77_15575, partial [Nitrospira sp.]|nr:hypothetical protein [Nitrospira sp.]
VCCHNPSLSSEPLRRSDQLGHPVGASRYQVNHQQYNPTQQQGPGTLRRNHGYSGRIQAHGNQSEA